MYRNIGKKLRGLAKFMFWFGAVCSIVIGITVILVGCVTTEKVLPMIKHTTVENPSFWSAQNLGDMPKWQVICLGVGIIVVGGLFSWVSSWLTYGVGEIAENIKHLK